MPEIIQKESGEVISNSYVEIAKYVAQTRGYPSILDGMKAVYRRMIFASKGFNSKVKSNIITAETMKYHPHGEAYGTLESLACKYGRLPLYTGYGNFGGAGFRAASSRYTSAVLNEIGRLTYLELVDHADYVEGDAGLMEPTYLPSLIPYSLITGNKGMTVGLPTPNIPAFNLMDLINFCKSRLTGKDCPYPRPDYGDCYLNCSQEDLKELYETGHGTIWFKIKFKRIDNKIIVTDLPPRHRHWTAWKKIKEYIDSGDIDYLENIDENGLSYEYILNDSSKISMDELMDIFMKYADSKETYRMYFERDGSVYLCSLNFLIEESQKYLRTCAIRKFKKDKESLQYKIEVFDAINKLRESDELQQISSNSSDYFKELIQSWGFSRDIANSVMSRSISYLTTSHNKEYKDAKSELDYLSRMEENPNEYLISLYDRLIELITPLYTRQRHSNWITESIDENLIGYWFDKGTITTGLVSDGYLPYNGMMYEVYGDGRIKPRFLSKELSLSINSDAMKVVSSSNPKYVIVIWENYMSVIPVRQINVDKVYLKVWEGYEMKNALISDKDEVTIVTSSGKSKNINLSSFVKKRISLPVRVFKDGEIIEEIK